MGEFEIGDFIVVKSNAKYNSDLRNKTGIIKKILAHYPEHNDYFYEFETNETNKRTHNVWGDDLQLMYQQDMTLEQYVLMRS